MKKYKEILSEQLSNRQNQLGKVQTSSQDLSSFGAGKQTLSSLFDFRMSLGARARSGCVCGLLIMFPNIESKHWRVGYNSTGKDFASLMVALAHSII